MILTAGCDPGGPDDPTSNTAGNLEAHGAAFRAPCAHGGGHSGSAGTNGAAGKLGSAGTNGEAGKLGSAGTNGEAGKLGSGGNHGAGGAGGGPSTCAPSGMVSWWHADGNYNDAVGSNNGMSGGDVTFGPGEINQAFQLDGTTNAHVTVPDASNLDITGPITIDAWINSTTLNGRIVDKITAFASDGYLLDLVGGQLRLIIGSDGLDSPVLAAGVLTHVAGVYDGTTLSLYVNGMLVASAATAQTSIPVNSNPLNIGCDSSGNSNFTGIIDEPRVFNRALSAAEILAVFQAESAHCQ